MAEIVLFHHVGGLTPGVVGLAQQLREAGHTVHTPDLFDGHTFTDLHDGIAYVGRVGEETFAARARGAGCILPLRHHCAVMVGGHVACWRAVPSPRHRK